MKMSMTGQPKGQLWLIFTMLFVTSAMHSEGASSFAPPSLSVSPTYDPVIKVIGKVYCYRCFNEAHPDESHGKKHLEGAMVKVTCQANDQALVAFGYTRSNGKYSVILKGLPISNNYRADSCKVELHGAPGGSDCNVPIELNLSGLSVYSKSSEEVVFKANQIMAFASKNTIGCSKPQTQPPMHPYSSPPLPYQYPSPPVIHKSPPLPYQYSPPPSNQLPPPAYQYPSPPQNYYISPPPYQQSMLPNSYQIPPPLQSTKSPVQPHKYLPPPYYFNSPPPQHQHNYVPPPLAYQYPPPPFVHKSPLLPSSPAAPYHYNSPPTYQYSPPPYNYQSSPPPAQYSPPLPPNAPKHLHPNAPHAKSPPLAYQYPPPPFVHSSPLLPSSPAAPYYYNSPPTYQYSPPPYNYQSLPPPAQYSPPLLPNAPKRLHPNVPHAISPAASPQPLYQYNIPPPPNGVMPSTVPPLHSYQSPPPTNQLS